MKIRMIYITAADREEARRIAETLVSERLAAGVNILAGVNSLYRWKGEIRDEREAVLIAKTTEALVPDLVERVKALHSYECPCIVSLPVAAGNPAFLEWVAAETT